MAGKAELDWVEGASPELEAAGTQDPGPGGEEYPPNARADQQDGVERLESCYLGCAFSPREIFFIPEFAHSFIHSFLQQISAQYLS